MRPEPQYAPIDQDDIVTLARLSADAAWEEYGKAVDAYGDGLINAETLAEVRRNAEILEGHFAFVSGQRG